MSVRKEAWKNPEIATQEELLEMFLKQRAWQRAAKKKAAKANSELEKLRSAWWDVRYYVLAARQRLNMHERVSGTPLTGMLGHARASVQAALEALQKPYQN